MGYNLKWSLGDDHFFCFLYILYFYYICKINI